MIKSRQGRADELLPALELNFVEIDVSEAPQGDYADFGVGDERNVVVDGEAPDDAGVGVVLGARGYVDHEADLAAGDGGLDGGLAVLAQFVEWLGGGYAAMHEG